MDHSPRSGVVSCDGCQAGPTGIVGHERLFSHSMTPTELHFACRDCGRFWARTFGTEAPHEWREVARPAGEDVPGRPGTMPP